MIFIFPLIFKFVTPFHRMVETFACLGSARYSDFICCLSVMKGKNLNSGPSHRPSLDPSGLTVLLIAVNVQLRGTADASLMKTRLSPSGG